MSPRLDPPLCEGYHDGDVRPTPPATHRATLDDPPHQAGVAMLCTACVERAGAGMVAAGWRIDRLDPAEPLIPIRPIHHVHVAPSVTDPAEPLIPIRPIHHVHVAPSVTDPTVCWLTCNGTEYAREEFPAYMPSGILTEAVTRFVQHASAEHLAICP